MEAYNIIRIIVICISGICIYFGYKLFFLVTERQGKLKIEGKDAVVSLSDVGPGVFFALFGSIGMGVTLITQPYSVNTEELKTPEGVVTKVTNRTPASTSDGSISEIETLCVTDDVAKHFEQGLLIVKKLYEGKTASPFGEVDKEISEKAITFLQNTGAESNLVEIVKKSNSYHDYYFGVRVQMVLIYMHHKC